MSRPRKAWRCSACGAYTEIKVQWCAACGASFGGEHNLLPTPVLPPPPPPARPPAEPDENTGKNENKDERR